MPSPPGVAERPIFVVGCPRSGTTMFQLMLHAHPRLAVPPETRFLLEIYRRHRDFGDLREEAGRRRVARAVVRPRRTRFADLGVPRAAVVRGILDAAPTLGSCLQVPFQAYADRFGKPRWGVKRPSYFRHVDALLRMYPDAQFVHLVRDGATRPPRCSA